MHWIVDPGYASSILVRRAILEREVPYDDPLRRYRQWQMLMHGATVLDVGNHVLSVASTARTGRRPRSIATKMATGTTLTRSTNKLWPIRSLVRMLGSHPGEGGS